MSLKSRRKQENQQSSPGNILERQKETLFDAMQNALLWTISLFLCFLVSCIALFGDSRTDWSYYIVFLILFCVFFVSLCRLVTYARINHKFNKIRFSSEYTVTINCKKSTFLTKPISKYYSHIFCVIFKDAKGVKYCFITDGAPDFAIKSQKKELLNAELDLVCYKDTNFVKTFTHQQSNRKQ